MQSWADDKCVEERGSADLYCAFGNVREGG